MAGAYPIGSIAGIIRIQGAAQAQRDILGVQRSMTLTGESAGKAAAGIGRTETALAGAGRAASTASSGTAKFRAAQLSAVAASERYNAVLADENATLRQLASAEASVIRANERMKATAPTGAIAATTRQAETSAVAMSRAGTAMGGFVKTAAGLGLALGGFELVKKAIDIGKEASQFQQNMLLIQTNANASASEVKDMTAAVLDLSPQVATGPNDLAQALYHVEQNGLRGKQALEALTVGAQGAKIGMADVEDTTNTMTIALASGIDGVQNLQEAMGVMIATVGTGDMRFSDLNEALSGGLLTTAKNFGATTRDVGAALATLGDNGIRGKDAATGMRQAMMGFAKPAKEGKDALASIGLSMTDLGKDMSKHGLTFAFNDLEKHMTAAGITGNKVGGFITNAFGRKAGNSIGVIVGEIDRLNTKFDEVGKAGSSFGDKWTATTKTTAFAFQQLGAEFQASGIRLAENLLPAGAAVGTMLAHALPAALSMAGDALHPFVVGWEKLAPVLATVGHALGDVGHALGPAAPALEKVGTAALAVWVAFKGYQIVRVAANAVADYFATVQARAAAGLVGIRNYGAGVAGTLSGNATEAQLTSQIMQAEFAKVEAAAMEQAAALDRAAAADAEAYATMVAASDDATATMIANSANVARAAQTQAELSTAAAVATAEAADTAAADVALAGDTAAIGWAGVLGPLAAVGLGVGLLVSMFHKSDTASKEAASAAKAYTDALNQVGSGQGDRTTILDAITKQLSDNNVPENIEAVNKALGRTALTGRQFITAIESGGKPLADLRAQLEGVVKAGTSLGTVSSGKAVALVKTMTPAAKAAAAALKSLNDESAGMTKAQVKEIAQLKAFGTVAAPVAKVASQLHLTSDATQQYAAMLGLSVTKSGDLVDSTAANIRAIGAMSAAFNTATQTGSEFLSAMASFSKSGATSADRAALIGATLKAANGDALNFASSMNAAATADKQFVTDLASAAKSVGKHGESIGALIGSFVNLKTGVIDYNKTAAAPLISGLQSIQTAAMGAAQAEFQHARSYTNGKNAADAAYKVYVNQTRGALIDQAKQLGISTTEAGKLADKYFGMPKNVKTLIEAEGTDPIVTVLNKIGQQLSYLTHHPWVTTAKVDADTTSAEHKIADAQNVVNNFRQAHPALLKADPTDALHHIATAQNTVDNFRQHSRPTIDVDTSTAIGKLNYLLSLIPTGTHHFNVVADYSKHLASVTGATGGTVTGGTPGRDSVHALLMPGEEVIRTSQARKHRSLLKAINSGAQGFASGGTVGGQTAAEKAAAVAAANAMVERSLAGPFHSGLGGIADMLRKQIPGSAQAMSMLSQAINKAFTLTGVQTQLTAAKTALADMAQRVSDLRSGVTSTLASAFDPTKYGSVTDLLAGMSGATGANKTYAADVAHAGKLGLSTTFLRQLEASGNTATLDALGHASRGEIAQVNKAYLGYTGSVVAGGNTAVAYSGLAGPLAADQARVAQMERQQASLMGGIDKLLLGISRLTGQKAQITLNGKVIAESVIHSPEMIGLIDELGHHGLYGRR